MKLIIIPAIILLFIGLLSMTGLGATITGTTTNINSTKFGLNYIHEQASQGNIDFYLYDYNGDEVCFINGTGVIDDGSIVQVFGPYPPPTAEWLHDGTYTDLYYDTNHYCPVFYHERNTAGVFVPNNGRMDQAGAGTFNIAGSFGFIALITAIMAVGTIAGITIFGSGLTETSVRILAIGTAFLTLWAVLTYMSYPIILASGFYMYIIYFALTLCYTIGIIFNFSGTGSDL